LIPCVALTLTLGVVTSPWAQAPASADKAGPQTSSSSTGGDQQSSQADQGTGRGAEEQAKRKKAQELVVRGRALQQDKKTEQAMAAYSEALELDPNLVAASWELGWSHWVRKEYDKTVALWETVLRLQPDHAEAPQWLPKARSRAAKRRPFEGGGACAELSEGNPYVLSGDFVAMRPDHVDKEQTTPFRQKMLDQFAGEDIPSLLGTTVFVGDSITQMFNLPRFFRKQRVVNRGIGGDTMGGIRHLGILDRLADTIYNLKPKRIILMIGANDLVWSKGTCFETKLEQYELLVRTLRQDLPDTELWSVSVLPVRNEYASKNGDIQQFNEYGARVAAQHGARWLDVYAEFLNEEGQLSEAFSDGNIHLSTPGYRHLSAIYKREIFGKR